MPNGIAEVPQCSAFSDIGTIQNNHLHQQTVEVWISNGAYVSIGPTVSKVHPMLKLWTTKGERKLNFMRQVHPGTVLQGSFVPRSEYNKVHFLAELMKRFASGRKATLNMVNGGRLRLRKPTQSVPR